MKKSHRPETKVKNPEPQFDSPDWVIWAAWADRITFEDIKKRTGKSESDVIKMMRKNLKPSSFKLWRKRAKNQFLSSKIENGSIFDIFSILDHSGVESATFWSNRSRTVFHRLA